MADYYAVLTLSPQASLPDIKTRYRQLSLRYHPDRGGSMEKMMQLNEAYRILSNPLLRREYDQKHTSRSQSNSTTAHASYAYTAYTRPAATHTTPPHPTEQPLHRHTTQAYDRRAQPRPARKSHFWSWFTVMTVVVIAFLGYQIYTTVQPAAATTSTPSTTITPTSTTSATTTTTQPITTVTPDTTTQPSDTYTNTTYHHRSYYNQTSTDTTDTPTSSTTQDLQ